MYFDRCSTSGCVKISCGCHFWEFDSYLFFLQFNKWLRDSKSRVQDIFRRMDHDRDGKLTREQFITGVLNTSKFKNNFSTSLTE